MEQVRNFRFNDLVLYCKGWYEGTNDMFVDFERYIRMNEDYFYPPKMSRQNIIQYSLKAIDIVFENLTKEERHNHYLGTMAKFYDYVRHRMWLYNKDFEETLLFVVHEFLQGLDRKQIELIPPTYGKGKPKIGWGYKQGMTYKEMNNKVKSLWHI